MPVVFNHPEGGRVKLCLCCGGFYDVATRDGCPVCGFWGYTLHEKRWGNIRRSGLELVPDDEDDDDGADDEDDDYGEPDDDGPRPDDGVGPRFVVEVVESEFKKMYG